MKLSSIINKSSEYMNEEQFKNMFLKCAKDEAFMCKLRGILLKSIEFENLIYDINRDL